MYAVSPRKTRNIQSQGRLYQPVVPGGGIGCNSNGDGNKAQTGAFLKQYLLAGRGVKAEKRLGAGDRVLRGPPGMNQKETKAGGIGRREKVEAKTVSRLGTSPTHHEC